MSHIVTELSHHVTELSHHVTELSHAVTELSYTADRFLPASPTWNPMADNDAGKLEILTPILSHRINIIANGDIQRIVNTLDTIAEGLFSGSLK